MFGIAIYAYLAALLWIVVDPVSKKFINGIGFKISQFVIVTAGILPALLLWIYYGASMPIGNIALVLILTIISGFFLFLGYTLVYNSVGRAGVSNAYALEEIQPPLLILFGIIALSEHLSYIQLICISVIFLGIALIILTKGVSINRNVLPSAIGNTSWAIYWMLVIVAMLYYRSFVFPMLLVRVFAALFSLTYISASSIKHKKLEKHRVNTKTFYMLVLLALVLGIMDGSANILFAIVSFLNKVTLGGVIISIVPIATWFIGYLVYKEQITTKQKLGFVIATIGYIAITFV